MKTFCTTLGTSLLLVALLTISGASVFGQCGTTPKMSRANSSTYASSSFDSHGPIRPTTGVVYCHDPRNSGLVHLNMTSLSVLDDETEGIVKNNSHSLTPTVSGKSFIIKCICEVSEFVDRAKNAYRQ